MLTQFLFLVVFFLINIFFNLMHYASLKIKLHNFFKLFSIKLPHSNELDCWLNRSTRIFFFISSFNIYLTGKLWLLFFIIFFFTLWGYPSVNLSAWWFEHHVYKLFSTCYCFEGNQEQVSLCILEHQAKDQTISKKDMLPKQLAQKNKKT